MTARGPRKRGKKSIARGRPYQRLVAEIARAFDPGAKIDEGVWVPGPDGRLDLDVSIRGKVDAREVLTVIECKDFARNATGPVGRAFVDAFDSKREDLGADNALICSNAGFTRDALSKARRKGIGMISVLKAGDARVKAVIEQEIVLCRLRIPSWTFTYHFADEGGRLLQPAVHRLRFDGLSLDSWLQHRGSLIATANPGFDKEVRADFRFLEPVCFSSPGGPVSLAAASVTFSYQTEWLSQVIQLDTSLGFYDYVRGQLRMASGASSLIMKGVNFDTATPIPRPENPKRSPRAPGEVRIAMTMVDGLNNEGVQQVAPLEALTRPEDLETRIEGFELQWNPT